AATGVATAIIELRESRQNTHRLLERTRELYSQLSSLGVVSENLRMRSRRVVEDARSIREGRIKWYFDLRSLANVRFAPKATEVLVAAKMNSTVIQSPRRRARAA